MPVEDFQATITEVRPSAGEEEYVTSGFLRSSNQVDSSDSTELFTDPTYTADDARRLSSTSYSLVRIPIDPIVHTFRPGTELRVVISAPGGDRPVWEFDTVDNGQRATVGIGGRTGSALVVNVVGGVPGHRRPCRRATHCGVSPAAPTGPRATRPATRPVDSTGGLATDG